MKDKVLVLIGVLLFIPAFCGAQQILSLEQAIGIALEKNYDVLIAKQNAQVSVTDNSYVIGAFLPQVNANASTVWNQNSQEFKFDDEKRNVSGNARANNTAASLQLVWTLFDGTRMFATRERIQQLEAQGQYALKDQMVNTIASVITNYYNIVRQKQQLKAIQEQMSVNDERVKLAERKLQVGTGSKPELLQAKVDLNAQKTAVLQQETVIIQLKEQLNVLLGMEMNEPFEVTDTIVMEGDISRDEILEKLNTTNYSLLAAQRSLNVTKQVIKERKAERLPFLNFTSAYAISQTNNTKLVNPFSAVQTQQNGFNYGFTLSLPILNGFNTSRLIKQAQISMNRQSLVLNQQRNNAQVAVRNAYISYENAIKVLQIEEENIVLAKENVSIALESFKRGVSTFIELRTAQQSLETAYNRLITARYNAKVAETELLRLSGALLK